MTSFPTFCEKLGCKLCNVRWSWCALAPDGFRVLFTIWSDELSNGRFVLYPTTERRPGEIDQSANVGNGAKEIQRVARYVVENHSNVEVYGIICDAVDPEVTPRRRKSFDHTVVKRLRVKREDGDKYVAYAEEGGIPAETLFAH